MRVSRVPQGGRWASPLQPAPKSFYTFPRTSGTPIAASAAYAQALGRQMLYGREGATFPGSGTAWPAPGSTGKNGSHEGIFGSYGWIGSSGASMSEYTSKENQPGLFVIPPSMKGAHPTAKVFLVNAVTSAELKKAQEKGEPAEETMKGGNYVELSKKLTAVPIPLLSNILFANSPAGSPFYGPFSAGTDYPICIWDPWNDTYYEFHRLGVFTKEVKEEGLTAHVGDYHAGDGFVVKGVSTWNGVCPVNSEGHGSGKELSASGTSIGAGIVTHQDIVEVLRASAKGVVLPLRHMVRCGCPVHTNSFVAPAVNHDSAEEKNTKELLSDAVHLNPAYGLVDGVPEGTVLTVPFASRASEFAGLTLPLQKSLYETVRLHGLYVGETAGIFALEWEGWYNVGSIYDGAKVDPYGASGLSYFSDVTAKVPTALRDASLPLLKDKPGAGSGAEPTDTAYNLLSALAPNLEQIEPSAITTYMAETAHKHILEAESGEGVLIPE